MAYTAVPTITTGDVATAAWGNTYIKDNFAAGVPDIFTTDGDMAVGTGANAAERVSVMNASNLLKHEVGGLEFDAQLITTNGAVGGASSGVMEIKTAVTQAEAQAGTGTRFSLWSPVRVEEAITALAAANMVLIASVEASADAAVVVSGLNTTYLTYLIVLADWHPEEDSRYVRFRIGDSGGIESGASDYAWHAGNVGSSSASYAATVDATSDHIALSAQAGVGTSAGEGFQGAFWLSGAASVPTLHGTYSFLDAAGVIKGGCLTGQRLAVRAVTQIELSWSSGECATGRVSVYGIKHA